MLISMANNQNGGGGGCDAFGPKARAVSRQVAQATVPSAESRASKNRFCPNTTLAGVRGLDGEITHVVKAAGRPT
jgi:hypothetical protein